MRTLAIVNQKGGCGKTTTAINLAAVFARRGRRTLLVDMDPQSHCAAGLGVPETRVERGIGDILLGDLDRPFDGRDFLWEVSRNLHLAPSTVSLAGLEAAGGGLSGLADRDRRLSRLLAWLAPQFDLCVVDCPPTIGLLTFNALRAADEALVPVETGYFALRGAEKQIATIERTAAKIGRPIPFRLVATLFDESRAVDRDVLEVLRSRYGAIVLPQVVRDHASLREASSLGQAITEYAPCGEAGGDFEALADWLLANPPMPLPASPAVEPEPAHRPTWQPASLGAIARSPLAAADPVPVPQDVRFDQPAPTSRAAELVRRVRELSARPTREELAMLHGDPPSATEAAKAPDSGVGFRIIAGGVDLVLPRGHAAEIRVVGDFNAWQPDGVTLSPRREGDLVGGTLPLGPGRHRYRLIVDGREALDPTNPLHAEGPDGREASVIEVPAV